MVLCALVAAGASVASLKRARDQALPAAVTLTGDSRTIPASFLGLSVEMGELASFTRAGAALDRVLSLLRTPSGSPILLRVGGRSADETYWNASTADAPRWVFAPGAEWLAQLGSLVRRDNLRVTLALNVAVHSPLMASEFARAVLGALPAGGLAGLAVGNEPDMFRWQTSLDEERVPSTTASTPLDWARGYSAADYWRDYRSYARALAASVPGIPLVGPEATGLTPGWLAGVAGLGGLAPSSLTVHRYASSKCWSQASPAYPSISLLASERASAGLAAGLRSSIEFAHRRGMSFRVTELNSVSCGGNAGVADSFATALWAPDVLFELIRAGVDGTNWHIRADMVNAPFEVLAGAIEPRPELYGLVLFAQMIDPGARLVGVRIVAAGGLHIKAWAVRSPTRTEVLLVNKGPRAADVSLYCRRTRGRAWIERLLAPSIGATGGVTLGGRTIGFDGRWHGRGVTASIEPSGGRYRVVLPGYSAALTVMPAR